MDVLLTRPKQDSEALAVRLQAQGRTCLVEPMLTIRPCEGVYLSLEKVQAFLLTSANGARALAGATSQRGLPVYAVGDATADAARGLGFEKVQSADGDLQNLIHLIVERVDPKAGILLHTAGQAVAGDLTGALCGQGYNARREALYDAVPVTKISAATADALGKGRIGAVLFFSPRTAAAFVRLVCDAGLAAHCKGVLAICLSPAVASAARGVAWKALRVAAHPDEGALIRELDR